MAVTPGRLEEVKATIASAMEANNVITLLTYYLTDYGEAALNAIASSILEKYKRPDLVDIVYTAAKELITNATKANVKRLLLLEKGLDPSHEESYQEILKDLKGAMVEGNIQKFKKRLKASNYQVTVSFKYSSEVLIIQVRNAAVLLPQEEARIREKFKKAQGYENLFDFYMEHGDQTEGAGLGLTMIAILLDQSGIEKHAFTLYFDEVRKQTSARLEIPLRPDYIPLRKRFQIELDRNPGASPESLRRRYSAQI